LIHKAEAEHIAFKIAKRYRPQPEMLYSGENDDQICFEFHMNKMEWDLNDIPYITDRIKRKELEYWFSGIAEMIVPKFAVHEDDTKRSAMVKDKLQEHFNGKQKSIHESLEKLMEGEPIAKDNFYDIQDLTIDLEEKYVVARRMGEAGVFSLKSTYINLMQVKQPHMIEEWIREFDVQEWDPIKGSWKKLPELTFEAFKKFVLGVARIDEKISEHTWGSMTLELTSQSEHRDPRDVCTSVRSRSDSGLEEEVSEEDSDSATDASLSVTGQRRTTRVCGCPLCGDAHLLMR
jgi:predicted Fe-Mo cluster-binding NifX family protein